MTIGNWGDPAIFGADYTGSDTRKTWNGGNGKYDTTPAGKKRSQWNNFTMTRIYRRRTSNKWTCTKVSDGSTFQTGAQVVPSLISVPPSLELTAQSRLVGRIKGHDFNLAVNAAQSKQLIDMVTSNLGKLGRSIVALKHGNFGQAARALGARPRASKLKPSDISGRWLELQYGWLPALSDTFAAAEAYEALTKFERQTTFRSSASQTIRSESVVSNFATTTSVMQCRCTVSIRAELYEKLSAPRSLGLQDPLSVAWEILPYSFVVDWFVPIGTYLSALAVLPHLLGRFSTTKSVVYSGFEPLTYKGPLPAAFGGFNCSKIVYEGTDTVRGVSLIRTGSSNLTTARPRFDQSGLRGKRIANAIALAYQRFSR